MNKDKSIAVLTWKLTNYGTALQAFALNLYLRNKGYKSFLINYSLKYENLLHVNDDVNRRGEKISLEGIKRVLNRKKKKILERKRKFVEKRYTEQIQISKRKFEDFYFQIPHVGSDLYRKENLVDLSEKFQYFICGSDQIWNPQFLDEAYYLKFVEKAKKIAYAPSMGVMKLTDSEKNVIIPWIKELDAVSVRENQTALYLKENGIENIEVVADPTLLLDQKIWNAVIPTTKLIKTNQKIIFAYFLSDNKWYGHIISSIKKMYPDAFWVTIPKTYYTYNKMGFALKIPEAGPVEFLNIIRQADMVLTDSYHGVCMSIKYQKEFRALKRFSDIEHNSENVRLESLLTMLGLEQFFIGKNEKIDLSEKINWSLVDSNMNILVKRSEKFLEDNLK